jgi:hypothetical protein
MVRWIALLTVPAVAVLITVLVLGQGSAFDLPLTMQRTLSPFPGKWSRIAADSAESSNDFRDAIKKTYREEFMKESGMFGSGYKYSAAFMRDAALSFYTRNVMADPSPKGLAQAHAVMVNYLYDLDMIEANHEAFSNKNEVVASSGVRQLLRHKAPRETRNSHLL